MGTDCEGIIAMDANDVIRRAAGDLAAEYGEDLIVAADQILAGHSPPEPDAHRGLVKDGITVGAHVIATAYYLYGLAPVMVETWNVTRNLVQVEQAAAQVTKHGNELPEHIRRACIDSVKCAIEDLSKEPSGK